MAVQRSGRVTLDDGSTRNIFLETHTQTHTHTHTSRTHAHTHTHTHPHTHTHTQLLPALLNDISVQELTHRLLAA